MSAMGQKLTLERGSAMSASPIRADMLSIGTYVRFVPQADIALMSSARRWEQERGHRAHTPFRPFIRRLVASILPRALEPPHALPRLPSDSLSTFFSFG